MLIDGFPRDAERWTPFKEFTKPYWAPSRKSVLVVLDVEKEVALKRFTERGRPGDVFEKRFNEHANNIGEVVEVMRKDGMTVCAVSKEENDDVQITVKKLSGLLD